MYPSQQPQLPGALSQGRQADAVLCTNSVGAGAVGVGEGEHLAHSIVGELAVGVSKPRAGYTLNAVEDSLLGNTVVGGNNRSTLPSYVAPNDFGDILVGKFGAPTTRTATARHHVCRVLRGRAGVQVGRVNTQRVVAGVKHANALLLGELLWRGAYLGCIGHSVCAEADAGYFGLPVPVRGYSVRPQPASICLHHGVRRDVSKKVAYKVLLLRAARVILADKLQVSRLYAPAVATGVDYVSVEWSGKRDIVVDVVRKSLRGEVKYTVAEAVADSPVRALGLPHPAKAGPVTYSVGDELVVKHECSNVGISEVASWEASSYTISRKGRKC